MRLNQGKSMQQLLSLDIQIPKQTKKIEPTEGLKQTVDKNDLEGIDFKEFLTNLIADKPKESKENDTLSLKNDKKEIKKEENSTSLENILNLVTFLKSNGLEGKFPTDDKKLSKILDDKQALQDFKEVKNLDDILKVAKKYNIEIKEFNFTKEIDTKENSFKDLQYSKKSTTNKLTQESSNEAKKITTSSIRVLDTLKNKTDQKDNPKITQKEDILSALLSEKEIKIKDKFESKLETQKYFVKKEMEIKVDKGKIETNLKDKKSVISDTQTIKKIDEKKYNNNKTLNVADTKENIKNHSTRVNEIKQNSTFENSKYFNKIINKTKSSPKKIITNNKTKYKDHKEATKIVQKEKKYIDTSTQQRDDAIQNSSTKSYIQHTTTTKINDAKQSLNTFANDLKEQIENYKPPIMKIKMTLSPKDLGDVNVNLISRGNSLQVTINSNYNTMALFTQNQAEFKNALVNMGFTNLNMSFSSNSNQNKEQQHSSKHNSKPLEEFSEDELMQIDTIELTIPRYI